MQEYQLRNELSKLKRVIQATHKHAVKHENCEVTNCPICDGGLFVCRDCGAAEAEAEERVCSGPKSVVTDEIVEVAYSLSTCASISEMRTALEGAAHSHYSERKFKMMDLVTKKSGANWTGRVVGFYRTILTPVGYCVESESERGSVQIYPEAALQLVVDEQGLTDEDKRIRAIYAGITDQNSALKEEQIAMGHDPRVLDDMDTEVVRSGPMSDEYVEFRDAFVNWCIELNFQGRHPDGTPILGKFEAEELWRKGRKFFGFKK